MSFVAILGVSDSPFHFWQRKRTWQGAVRFLVRSMAAIESAELKSRIPLFIVSHQVVAGAANALGQQIYPDHARGSSWPLKTVLEALPTRADPILQTSLKTYVVCMGDPRCEKAHIWRRCRSWVDAVPLLKDAERIVEEWQLSPRLIQIHVYPEYLAKAFQKADGSAMFPLTFYERTQHVIMN